MSWFVFVLIFSALWLIELGFGWLLGGHIRELVFLAALVYFGITINTLKTAQDELQKELKRLWKTVKTLQESNTTPQHQQSAQAQSVNTDVPDNTQDIDDAENESPDMASKADIGAVALENAGLPISEAHAAISSDDPVLAKDIPVSAQAEVLPSPRYTWTDEDRSWQDQSTNVFEEWLAGGNWIVRFGLAILFIGLVFLAKFAYENALLPLELRLAAIAGSAVALLTVGWRSRLNRPNYGLTLQGGGVAVLYLTIFATAKLTDLLPSVVAMSLMLLVAILAAGLAILQDAMVLAVIGTIGGFMAPILLSTGQGSHVALFSYFAALDVSILTVALRKAWRPLNVLAFFFTYGIAGLWAMRSYKPEYQFSCLLFLALFFALFVIVSTLFTKHQTDEGEYNHTIDATLLFGVPTATFTYGFYLLKPYEYGGAWLAVLLSAIYLVLAYSARGKDRIGQLKTPWAALSLLLTTLAVPLAFDARLTSSIWVLEGAAVISYGWWQMQTKTRWFGYLLVVLGSVGFVMHWPEFSVNSVPILNTLTVGLLLLTLAYGVIGWSVNRFNKAADPDLVETAADEANIVSWLMAIAMALAGALIIVTEVFHRNLGTIASIAVPALLWLWALALQRIARVTHWRQALAPTALLPLLTLMPIPFCWLDLTMPGLGFTTVALLGLLMLQALVLKQILPDLKALFETGILPAIISSIPGFTLVAYWLTLLVRGRSAFSSALIPDSGLTMHGWFLPLAIALPIMLIWWLAQPKADDKMSGNSPVLWRWLHGDDGLPNNVVNKQLSVFAFFTIIFIMATTLLHSGRGPYGLTYIPVLNLYELVASSGLLALLRLLRNTEIGLAVFGENRIKFLYVLLFAFANSILSRILVNFYGAEFGFGFAWHSAIAATTYSIVWTLAALVMMWLASSRMKRGLWITGAVVLGIVAIKLLMVDLSRVGSLARIISFIGVGVLMLVVGYVAPIPADNSKNEV